MSIEQMTRFLTCQLVLAACALAQSKTAIDNDQVKVLLAFQEPRVRTPLHEHPFNRVMIYEQAGYQEIDDLHKRPYTINFKAGEVKWSPQSGMHTAEVFTQLPVPIVEIEIKRPGNPSLLVPGPLDPLKVDPKHYKLEFENNQVRVLRVTIGPHEKTPLHQHAVNRVVTYLTNQDFRVTSQDGKVEQTKHAAGEVSWGTPGVHTEENMSDKAFEAVVTELKD